MTTLPRLSASKIKTLHTCSWTYQCQYVYKLSSPSNSGASIGSVIHLILECLLNPRHRKYIELLTDGQFDNVPSIHKLALKHAAKLGVDDEDSFERIQKMTAVALVNDFLCKGSIKLESEKKFTIENNKYSITGFIDKLATFPDGTYKVFDFKSQKVKYTSDELDSNIQALTYSLAVYKETGIIPIVEFIMLRFPKNPIQRAPLYTEKQLLGFEAYLEENAKFIKNFNIKNAKANLAAKGANRWLCGRTAYPGQLKEDGSLAWCCPYKFPFDYYLLMDEDGVTVKTSKIASELKPKKTESVIKLKYQGCPAFNNKVTAPKIS